MLDYIERCCFEKAVLEDVEIWLLHRELENQMGEMDFGKRDEILCLSNDLCYHYAQNAFSQGFSTGLRLAVEIGKQ